MTYKNIMQLAKENGYKKIKIKRNTWGESWAVVEKLKLNPHNEYGKAYGHIEYSNGNIEDGEIGCAGNFSWRVVEVLDEDMMLL